MTDMKYFEGAIMAYNDCAKFIEESIKNLPPEIKFLESTLGIFAAGFRDKAKNVIGNLLEAIPTGEDQ